MSKLPRRLAWFVLFPLLSGCIVFLHVPLKPATSPQDSVAKVGELASFSVQPPSVTRILFQWQRAEKGKSNFVNVPDIGTEVLASTIIAASGEVGTNKLKTVTYRFLASAADDGAQFRVCFNPTEKSESDDPAFIVKNYKEGCSSAAVLTVK